MAMGTVLDNIPFDLEELEASVPNEVLGRFVTAWSEIEVVCNHLFRRMAGLDTHLATIIFCHVQTRDIIRICSALAQGLEQDLHRTRAVELFREVRRASEVRNAVFHARWGKSNGAAARFAFQTDYSPLEETIDTQKARAKQEKGVLTVAEIAEKTTEFVSLRDRLRDFLMELVSGRARSRQEQANRALKMRREAFERTTGQPWPGAPLSHVKE